MFNKIREFKGYLFASDEELSDQQIRTRIFWKWILFLIVIGVGLGVEYACDGVLRGTVEQAWRQLAFMVPLWGIYVLLLAWAELKDRLPLPGDPHFQGEKTKDQVLHDVSFWAMKFQIFALFIAVTTKLDHCRYSSYVPWSAIVAWFAGMYLTNFLLRNKLERAFHFRDREDPEEDSVLDPDEEMRHAMRALSRLRSATLAEKHDEHLAQRTAESTESTESAQDAVVVEPPKDEGVVDIFGAARARVEAADEAKAVP